MTLHHPKAQPHPAQSGNSWGWSWWDLVFLAHCPVHRACGQKGAGMALPQYSAEASGEVWVWVHFCICTFRKTIFAAAQRQPGGLLVTCDWVPSVKWEVATFSSPVHSYHGALRLKGSEAGKHGMSLKYVNDQAVLITLSFGWYHLELWTSTIGKSLGQSLCPPGLDRAVSANIRKAKHLCFFLAVGHTVACVWQSTSGGFSWLLCLAETTW